MSATAYAAVMLRWLRRTLRDPPPQPSWLAVAYARNQIEAEIILGILREYGIPAFFRRTLGVDVPELFATGARVILVPAERAQEARTLLEEMQDGDDAEASGPLPPPPPGE